MVRLIQLIYQIFLPPSGIILLLLCCLIFERYRQKKWNRILIAIIGLFYFLSTGIGADILVRPLEKMYAPTTGLQGDVLLLMCSGANQYVLDVDGVGSPAPIMAKSMLTAAQLYQKTRLPILICGGGANNHIIKEAEIAKRDLENIGVPEEKIYIEKDSRNTAEGAKNAALLLKKHGWNHPILLAAALHTPRSLSLFLREDEDIDMIVYPTYYRKSTLNTTFSVSSLIPSSGNLDDSAMAIKEYLGLLAIKFKLQ